MQYSMILITQPQIIDGYWWHILEQIDTIGSGYIAERNTLRLSHAAATAIIQYSDVVDTEEQLILTGSLTGQIVTAALYWGKDADKTITKAAHAVFGQDRYRDLVNNGVYKALGGAILHTTNQDRTWSWASALLPESSQLFPHEHRKSFA